MAREGGALSQTILQSDEYMDFAMLRHKQMAQKTSLTFVVHFSQNLSA